MRDSMTCTQLQHRTKTCRHFRRRCKLSRNRERIRCLGHNSPRYCRVSIDFLIKSLKNHRHWRLFPGRERWATGSHYDDKIPASVHAFHVNTRPHSSLFIHSSLPTPFFLPSFLKCRNQADSMRKSRRRRTERKRKGGSERNAEGAIERKNESSERMRGANEGASERVANMAVYRFKASVF